MSIRFIHLADVHYDRENQDAAAKSLEAVIETGRAHKVHFFAIAGDLFNRGIANSEAGGLPRLLDLIQRMLDVAPIVAAEGTETHDLPGSYAPFLKLRGRDDHNFRILEPGKSYYFDAFNDCIHSDFIEGQTSVLILGCPEPGKEWFLASSSGIGKDEADKKVIEGMRGILLGMGAKRAEHPDLPCVFLYHGGIMGAKMGKGQLATGGINIGREDLQLVDPNIDAYYGGSCRYGDNDTWQEDDIKGFNLVTLEPGETYGALGHFHLNQHVTMGKGAQVERILFAHLPPRKKIIVDWPDGAGDDVRGFQSWVVIRASKDIAKNIPSLEGIRDAYIRTQGALPGSRVTVEITATETVRAAEITEKHRLREKVEIFAEASNDKGTSVSIMEKADTLERDAESDGIITEGLHIRLRKLRLRGAIGIWKGQGVDEVVLDFDRYDAGLIALTWPNGKGKTTLIENCHPYPCMLTREGTLQQHFRLRDSLRELEFIDERTEEEYRALILIDGQNSSGTCEYHLFRDDKPLTNGRKADYEEKILALFGSMELFLRSAFVSQKSTKNNPDLAEATKGEKKAIFRELAGLDYLQAYADSAKGKGDAIEAEISTECTRLEVMEGQLEKLPEILSERQQRMDQVDHERIHLSELEQGGVARKSEAEQLGKKLQAQRLIEQKINSLENENKKRVLSINETERKIVEYAKAVERKPAAEKIIDAHEKLSKQEAEENEKISKIIIERSRLQGEYNDRLRAHHADVQAIEGKRSALKAKVATLDGDLRVLKTQTATPLKKNCPTCGQLLPKMKLEELQQKRAENEEKIAEILNEIERINLELKELVSPDNPTPPSLPPADTTALQRIRGQIEILKVGEARALLTTAQEATTRTEELRKQIVTTRDQVEKAEKEIADGNANLDPNLEVKHDRAQAMLENARREYTDAKAKLAAEEAALKALDAQIAELEGIAANLGERKAKIEVASHELAEWRYLERACGPDGIQALELDALGPGIAEVANRLLSAAYGTRFQIEFRTTRMAGKGSKVKQVEDFSIWILDNETGTEQELSTLSGGESVWVKRAIFDAFAIIRDKSTGQRFLTVFADEADGALDPEARRNYFAMLQAAHHESGRRNTVVITHSVEVQEMIPQRIEIAELSAVTA
jgi:exonuclease SbcC